MFIRVDFHDNDFSTPVREACKGFMFEVSRGYKGEEALGNYKEAFKKYGLEAFRKAIVLSAYGHYIANKGTRSFYEDVSAIYDLSEDTDILNYLDENISIEEIKNFKDEWENSEVCYIDFFERKVYLQ